MDAPTFCIEIAHLQAQSVPESQAETIDGEIEDPIAQFVGRPEQASRFLNGDDVRQPRGVRRLDQADHHPGLFQHVLVKELKAVQVEFDSASGVSAEQIGEIIGQLHFGQVMELMAEIVADTADGARVGLNGLGLKAFEPEVLQVRLVVLIEI
jgi:hypothetical protein